MDRANNVFWVFPARMKGIEHMTKQLVSEDADDLMLVDLAGGFSPRGLHLAHNYPTASVIEVDLPEVVKEKQSRLASGNISIPDNMTFIEADLAITNLDDALGGRKADLITSEGLTLYLTADEMERFFQMTSASLKPGGLLIVEMYFNDKATQLRQNRDTNTVASFVMQMVGNMPGIVKDMETALGYFERAGLVDVTEYPLVDLMAELGEPKPIDVISVMTARKPQPDTVED
jgi:O-methyltransferase involved in polyketide biosynthesis